MTISTTSALARIQTFLHCETPDAWIATATLPANQAVLLLDHANCEKKAASTAVNLMYRYVGDFELMHKMSRLAREELRHYEQVMRYCLRSNYALPLCGRIAQTGAHPRACALH
jgi:tRNA isopentenyl-2-thiomethyl-A-37 hydroxylase MiaE